MNDVLKYYRSPVVVIASVIFIISLFASCEQHQKNSTHQNVSDGSIDMGKQLAAMYCQSCHLLPDPSLLDTKSWEKGVLPTMGPRLGIFNYGYQTYSSYKYDHDLGDNFYPSQPVITEPQWQSILDYYTALSPDTLEANKNDIAITSGLSLFTAITAPASYDSAHTCFAGFDSIMYPRTLVVGDVNKKEVVRFNSQLRPVDSFLAKDPVVDIDFKKDSAVVANIGVIIPNNGRYGSGHNLTVNAANKMEYNSTSMFDSLRRPVQMTASDFNKDGKEDYLICEYGNLRGALSWMENLGSKKFERHVLREVPGAIKAYVRDYNKDGLPDIYVLFAQGDESIFLYTNKGNGKFEEKQLLRFPPCYGSTYFELADFNKDGFDDIVYSCGDNADFSRVLKPYHGIYIYTNDGKNNFAQQYFFHINGCFKAMARDFDNDGDLDIASISFFADYKNRPEEGFVYFQNNGSFNFKPYNIPETNQGRWLTMDAGDLDGDGKIDLVLGNFSAPGMIKSPVPFEKGPPFLLLKNTRK